MSRPKRRDCPWNPAASDHEAERNKGHQSDRRTEIHLNQVAVSSQQTDQPNGPHRSHQHVKNVRAEAQLFALIKNFAEQQRPIALFAIFLKIVPRDFVQRDHGGCRES